MKYSKAFIPAQNPGTQHYWGEVTAGSCRQLVTWYLQSGLLLTSISLLREPRIPSRECQAGWPQQARQRSISQMILDSTMTLQLTTLLTTFTSYATTDREMTSISRCAVHTASVVTRTKPCLTVHVSRRDTESRVLWSCVSHTLLPALWPMKRAEKRWRRVRA